MNCNTFRAQLAEFVGGELDPVRRAAAVEHLKICAHCSAQAGGLQAAAKALKASLLSQDAAFSQSAELRAPQIVCGDAGELATPPSHGIMRYAYLPWLGGLARYAAVIIVAFAAGFAYRAGEIPKADAPAPVVDPTIGLTVQPKINPVYVRRFAQATNDYPASSTLTHSLLSLASQ